MTVLVTDKVNLWHSVRGLAGTIAQLTAVLILLILILTAAAAVTIHE